ncbi:MAG TPA: hypothetical protein VLV50_04725 [Stellaceae bacterium]|nr:hypothetical protein [Stellaceae bacterium]
MRASKLVLATGRALVPMVDAEVASVPSPWRLPRLRLPRLFARKEPTLFQRCLAVHIHHTSNQSSLH